MTIAVADKWSNIAQLLLDEPGDGSGGGSDNTQGKPDSSGEKKPEGGDSGKKPDSTSGDRVTAPDRKAEDERNRGILADLQKERKARQEFERQVAAITAERDQERRRVQALAGVNPKSTEETDVEAVRARFGQVFPGLAKLTDTQIERLLSVAESADHLEQATTHHWQTHGKQMLDTVTAAITKELGGTLTERQLTRIKQAYVQEAAESALDERGHARPGTFLARHEASDPTLITEFVKAWIEDFIEPGRRRALATDIERQRRVPSGRDRSIAATGGKKLDYNDPKAVEDALVASFRDHGGEFGR